MMRSALVRWPYLLFAGLIWCNLQWAAWAQVDDLMPDTEGDPAAEATDAGESAAAQPPAEDPTPIVAEAEQLLAEKQWYQARALFLRAQRVMNVQDVPLGLRVYVGLAEASRGLKQWESALSYSAVALNYSGEYARTSPAIPAREHARAAEISLKIGNDRIQEAIDYLRTSIQLDPNNPEYMYLMGKALAELANDQRAKQLGNGAQELDEALRQLNAAAELRNDHADTFYERGGVNLIVGNVVDGIEDLRKCVSLDGTKSKYLARLGQTLLQRGAQVAQDPDGKPSEVSANYKEAIELLDRYIAIEGPRESQRKASGSRERDDEVPYELKEIYLSRADARTALALELAGKEAADMFRQAVADGELARAQDPDDLVIRARASYQTGVANYMLGNLAESLEAFTRTLRTPVRIPGGQLDDTTLRRGIVWYRLGDREMAFLDFKEAAEQGDPIALFWKGVVHAERGEYSLAVDSYGEALRIAPDYVAAYKNRGLAYMHLGLFRRAADDFEQLIRRDPYDQKALQLRQQAFQAIDLEIPPPLPQLQAAK